RVSQYLIGDPRHAESSRHGNADLRRPLEEIVPLDLQLDVPCKGEPGDEPDLHPFTARLELLLDPLPRLLLRDDGREPVLRVRDAPGLAARSVEIGADAIFEAEGSLDKVGEEGCDA